MVEFWRQMFIFVLSVFHSYTSLHYAAQQGNIKMAESLLNNHADVHLLASFNDHADVTALHLAAQNGHEKMVRLLVKSGANVNAGKLMGNVQGITPLHQAVSNKHVAAVRTLIELGADVNARATGTVRFSSVCFQNAFLLIAEEKMSFLF